MLAMSVTEISDVIIDVHTMTVMLLDFAIGSRETQKHPLAN